MVRHTKFKTIKLDNNFEIHFRRLLAEAALQTLDLATSETAFVQCQDYYGIKTIKQLANIQEVLLQQAEVAIYFGDFDKAETLYVKADRK